MHSGLSESVLHVYGVRVVGEVKAVFCIDRHA